MIKLYPHLYFNNKCEYKNMNTYTKLSTGEYKYLDYIICCDIPYPNISHRYKQKSRHNKLVPNAKWYITGNNDNNEKHHICTIYSDFSCDEDLEVINDSLDADALKKYSKILYEFFDKLKYSELDGDFWQYHCHSNTGITLSKILEDRELDF